MTRSPRVLPVLAAAGVVAALVLAVSSTARAQVWSSVHREPDRFLAIAFTHDQLARGCESVADTQTVAVDVQALGYRSKQLQVRYRVSAAGDRVHESIVAVAASDRSAVVTGTVKVPATGAYQIEVGVVGHQERLLMRCRSEERS